MPAAGKTGTAQVMDAHNHTIADTTWFASFAPYPTIPGTQCSSMVEIESQCQEVGRQNLRTDRA